VSGGPKQPDDQVDAAGGTDSSPLPFLGALVIIVVVLIAIGVFALTRGDGMTEDDRAARAAVAQNDALQRQSFADYRTYTCAANVGTEADMIARQRDSVNKVGERYVDGVAGVSINGDHATAVVTYHFAKTPDTKTPTPTSFAREGGSWKVC
jgi:hypothetical protein